MLTSVGVECCSPSRAAIGACASRWLSLKAKNMCPSASIVGLTGFDRSRLQICCTLRVDTGLVSCSPSERDRR
jgi:hypothetical protein